MEQNNYAKNYDIDPKGCLFGMFLLTSGLATFALGVMGYEGMQVAGVIKPKPKNVKTESISDRLKKEPNHVTSNADKTCFRLNIHYPNENLTFRFKDHNFDSKPDELEIRSEITCGRLYNLSYGTTISERLISDREKLERWYKMYEKHRKNKFK